MRPPRAAQNPLQNPLAREPLYADIVRRAGALKAQVQTYRAAPAALGPLPGFEAFKTEIGTLSPPRTCRVTSTSPSAERTAI